MPLALMAAEQAPAPAVRVVFHVYRAPAGSPARFLVVRWTATEGQPRATCDDPIPALDMPAAHAAIPEGFVQHVKKPRKGDLLLEVWTEPKPKEQRR